jgi:hypothetical protein
MMMMIMREEKEPKPYKEEKTRENRRGTGDSLASASM